MATSLARHTVVFPAVEHFAEAVAALGPELQPADSFCYSPELDLELCQHRPLQFSVGTARAQDGREGQGIVFRGVPDGDAT